MRFKKEPIKHVETAAEICSKIGLTQEQSDSVLVEMPEIPISRTKLATIIYHNSKNIPVRKIAEALEIKQKTVYNTYMSFYPDKIRKVGKRWVADSKIFYDNYKDDFFKTTKKGKDYISMCKAAECSNLDTDVLDNLLESKTLDRIRETYTLRGVNSVMKQTKNKYIKQTRS